MQKKRLNRPLYKAALSKLAPKNDSERWRILPRPIHYTAENGHRKKCYVLYVVKQSRDDTGKLSQHRITLKYRDLPLKVYDLPSTRAADEETINRAVELRRQIHDKDFFGGTGDNSQISFFKFLDDLADQKAAATKTDYYKSFIILQKKLIEFCDEIGQHDLFIGEISREFCEKFKTFLMRKYRPNSARQILLYFKIALSAVEDIYGFVNHARRIKIKVKDSDVTRRRLSQAEAKKLMSVGVDSRFDIVEFFRFLLLTGLRTTEARRLKFSDLETILVNDDLNKKIYRWRRHIEKSDKDHLMNFNYEASGIIEKQRERYGDRKQLFNIGSSTNARRLLIEWAKKCKIAPFTFHAARRFVIRTIRQQFGLYEAQQYIGHQNINTTMMYDVFDDVEKLNITLGMEEFLRGNGTIKDNKKTADKAPAVASNSKKLPKRGNA